jgi:surfeit locus 1 family protein
VVTKKNNDHSDTIGCGHKKSENRLFHHVVWISFTLLVFAFLVKLSLWQHSRGLEKQQRLTRITQLNQQSPLTLEQIVSLSKVDVVDPVTHTKKQENINDYPVTILGNFDNEKVFLLDNQVEKGSLGYRVYQIVQSEKHSVLVNLGWIQGSINRQEMPKFTPITGTHHFTGHIRLIEAGIMLMEQNLNDATWPLRIQQIEIDKFSLLVNKPLLPFVVYVDESDMLGFKKNWHAIVMPPEKHQAYAVQWAGLALAWLALMIWFNLFERGNKSKVRNNKNNNNKRNSSNKELPDE